MPGPNFKPSDQTPESNKTERRPRGDSLVQIGTGKRKPLNENNPKDYYQIIYEELSEGKRQPQSLLSLFQIKGTDFIKQMLLQKNSLDKNNDAHSESIFKAAETFLTQQNQAAEFKTDLVSTVKNCLTQSNKKLDITTKVKQKISLLESGIANGITTKLEALQEIKQFVDNELQQIKAKKTWFSGNTTYKDTKNLMAQIDNLIHSAAPKISTTKTFNSEQTQVKKHLEGLENFISERQTTKAKTGPGHARKP